MQGAIVAMDPSERRHLRDNNIADVSPMVHVPPYKGSKAVLDRRSRSDPAYDRAFQGTYPAGSTFKPITATAAC